MIVATQHWDCDLFLHVLCGVLTNCQMFLNKNMTNGRTRASFNNFRWNSSRFGWHCWKMLVLIYVELLQKHKGYSIYKYLPSPYKGNITTTQRLSDRDSWICQKLVGCSLTASPMFNWPQKVRKVLWSGGSDDARGGRNPCWNFLCGLRRCVVVQG